MYTTEFWKDLFGRAVATFAQTVLALVGVDMTGWLTVDWGTIGITGLIAAGLAILKGIGFAQVGAPVPSLSKYTYDKE